MFLTGMFGSARPAPGICAMAPKMFLPELEELKSAHDMRAGRRRSCYPGGRSPFAVLVVGHARAA